MSYDFSIGGSKLAPCDHLQILERYSLDSFDFRTLHYTGQSSFNMRAPINGVTMVRVWFGGSLVAPGDPVYGYSIVPDPDRIQKNYTFQKILFNHPVRLLNPLIEVTYVTRQAFCLKCQGTGRVADWVVGPSGSLSHVHGAHKLGQAAQKYILTSRNPFNPNLTTPIRSYLGRKFGLSVTDTDIATAVSRAMTSYQAIQRAQSTVQTLDPHEMIRNVLSVSAVQDSNDPTVVNVAVELQAYQQTEAIPLSFALQTNSGG